MNSLRTISGHLCVLAVLVTAGCGKSVPTFVEATLTVSVPSGISTEMLRAFIYDSESGELRGQIFISDREEHPDGTVTFTSTEKLRSGTYDIIAYNFDMPDTFIRGESNIGTLEAYTADVSEGILSRFGIYAASDVAISYTPDRMGVARIMGASVEEGVVIAGQLVPVTVMTYMELGAEGLQWSVTKSAVAGGFATTWFLGTGKAGGAGYVWFEMSSAGDSNMKASVPSFGEVSESYDFVFNVTTSGGSYCYTTTTDSSFKFDKSIVIPEPEHSEEENSSGFSPQVGEWNGMSIDVPIR